jgi:hypothetical protein
LSKIDDRLGLAGLAWYAGGGNPDKNESMTAVID